MTTPSDKLDDGKTAIQSRPRPGAYLLENMRGTAEYWLNAARNVEDRDEAVLAIEQVANCWKNAAYDFAEKLHFSGYLNQPGAPLPETQPSREMEELQALAGELRDSSKWRVSPAQKTILLNAADAVAALWHIKSADAIASRSTSGLPSEPPEWKELGGVPGPENEPAALVAWISTAMKEGAAETIRRMQKRLLLWEKAHLDPEDYELFKEMPIYTTPISEAVPSAIGLPK